MVAISIKIGMSETKIDQIHASIIFEVHVALTRNQHVIRLNVTVNEA